MAWCLVKHSNNFTFLPFTGALIGASKEDGLKLKAKKTKYKFTFRHRNAGQNHNLITTTKFFECGKTP
jgi:hypothetical protein